MSEHPEVIVEESPGMESPRPGSRPGTGQGEPSSRYL